MIVTQPESGVALVSTFNQTSLSFAAGRPLLNRSVRLIVVRSGQATNFFISSEVQAKQLATNKLD